MKRAMIVVGLLLWAFVSLGCKKQVEHQPQDFFSSSQLEIAQIIYEGSN